ncbi:unnamed protein product [Adineta steineri]|uniref:Uncharacterized protein n=1 Tax=Adineta steineri TaxID=433720 RepID=A0A815QJM1_9BILA|nr:unnamed protein product [Adineta steineri]CAF1464248.1 unnamed protein product [Adineta steineri]CAF3892634.1 unnamed protein product [Adineta steineri]
MEIDVYHEQPDHLYDCITYDSGRIYRHLGLGLSGHDGVILVAVADHDDYADVAVHSHLLDNVAFLDRDANVL